MMNKEEKMDVEEIINDIGYLSLGLKYSALGVEELKTESREDLRKIHSCVIRILNREKLDETYGSSDISETLIRIRNYRKKEIVNG